MIIHGGWTIELRDEGNWILFAVTQLFKNILESRQLKLNLLISYIKNMYFSGVIESYVLY